MAKTNFMNLDTFDMAAIKRIYQNNKKMYQKSAKIKEEIKLLENQDKYIQEQIDAMELGCKHLTLRKCGVELDSNTVLDFINNNKEQEFAQIISNKVDEIKTNTEESSSTFPTETIEENKETINY